MLTVIAYHPTGYEVRIEMESEKLEATLRWLEKHGYRPTRDIQYTPEGLPICPRHGVPMEKREKQSDTWYSHKVTDPTTGESLYCRGYALPSSPGWTINTSNGRREPETAEPEPEPPRQPPVPATPKPKQPVHTAQKPTPAVPTTNNPVVGQRVRANGNPGTADVTHINDELFGD